jgi:hypothetical protein
LKQDGRRVDEEEVEVKVVTVLEMWKSCGGQESVELWIADQ